MAAEFLNLHIQGMTCQACAHRIEKVLNKKAFINNCRVNFASETAQIEFDHRQTNAQELIQIIKQIGFQAHLDPAWLPEQHHQNNGRMWVLLLLSLPFMIGMLGMMMDKHQWMLPIGWQILLATVVQVYFALPFYQRAVGSMRGGLANMDVLVSMGTLTIYLYSLAMVLVGKIHDVYFEAGVMVLTFVSLGKHWEAKTKRGSLNALHSLHQLTPQHVSVFKNQIWQSLPIDQIQSGDLLRCVEGGRIAADGEVVSGEGWADESHLTGESQLIHKTIGDTVLAGSMLSGSLNYRAIKLGKHTLLGDMASALAEAQGSKAPIARLADRVVAIFVPVILVIAIITFLLNWLITGHVATAILRSVAVLVIACPCALGLATPAAMMAGMGQAIQRGVWFKHAAALETAGSINTVVLDKTGTITQGKPQIIDHWLAHHVAEHQLFDIITAVAQHSTHPLINAIAETGLSHERSALSIHHIHTVAGEGISASITSLGEVKVGKPAFCGFRLPEHLGQTWQTASLVAVSLNGQAIGAFALADALKPDSAATIQRLHDDGINVIILSGDHSAAVRHIATQLNVPDDHTYSNQSPRDKAQLIQQLQQNGMKVAMVGDGINDTAALTLADVGWAVYGSTDVATHSADVVLMQPSLHQLADGLLIARHTVSVIRQNLFFAFIYNLLSIPFAAVGWLTPMLAGAMMAMSSLSVLANALRLKRMKF